MSIPCKLNRCLSSRSSTGWRNSFANISYRIPYCQRIFNTPVCLSSCTDWDPGNRLQERFTASSGLLIPGQVSRKVTSRIKYSLCVNHQNPVSFVVSRYVPTSPKHFCANTASIFRVWLEASKAAAGKCVDGVTVALRAFLWRQCMTIGS